jgi:hypothetical protein
VSKVPFSRAEWPIPSCGPARQPVWTSVVERLHTHLRVGVYCGPFQDAAHPFVGIERLSLGDAECGQFAV